MKKISVVFHSGYGHTTNVANAVIAGIELVSDVEPTLISIDQNGDISNEQWSELDSSDAIVFGSPTYMGMASWQFKKFADTSSKRWAAQDWKDKVAAGFTNSATMNGDKHSTLHFMITLAMQHSMLWIGTGLMPSNNKAASRDDINYVGSFGGLMTTSPSDAGVDEAPTYGDIETSKLFGERVARVVRDLMK
ncbi:MAG: flavodoxin family protein [Gammaproteobacteria bacterium]|nr:flavodoxin family protein [Gammaproteobacteria bacterium]MCP5136380.1 flavodoxin family protein [Gammaproteobacteria bacterium]